MKKLLTTMILALLVCVSVAMGASANTTNSCNLSGTQSVAKNSTISFCVTSLSRPNITTGTNNVVNVNIWYIRGNKYYYKLKMVGNAGTGTGVYADGKLLFVCQSSSSTNTLKCSITGSITKGQGDYVQFTIKSNTNPNLTAAGDKCGLSFIGVENGVYSYVIYINEDAKGGFGVYANGQRIFVVNVIDSVPFVPTPDDSESQNVAEMIRLVNVERAKEGTAPVSYNDKINEVCKIRSRELAVKYDHERPSGTKKEMLDVRGVKYYGVSEIIVGLTCGCNAVDAMNVWMHSSHQSTIMCSGFTEVGAGVYLTESGAKYFVMLFVQN